jgi:uncharacterized protein YndB with AHSA1/START domain
MSFNSRVIAAPVDAVWEALVDPDTYPRWLIGAEEIRRVDGDWPAPGSSFHHRVGIWKLTVPDRSEVRSIEPGECLSLTVKARPFLSAIATFRLYPVRDAAATTVVTLEETPQLRWLGGLIAPLLEPSIHLRNQRSLRRLEGYLFATLASVVRP